MSYPNFSDEEIAQRGKELYEKQIRTSEKLSRSILSQVTTRLMMICLQHAVVCRHDMTIQFSGQKELDLMRFTQLGEH
jgi:hypothetical protein